MKTSLMPILHWVSILEIAAAVAWLIAYAQVLFFTENLFDILICKLDARVFFNHLQTLKKVFRVLKSGRFLVSKIIYALEDNPVVQIAQMLLEEFSPTDLSGFYHLPFGYHDGDELWIGWSF